MPRVITRAQQRAEQRHTAAIAAFAAAEFGEQGETEEQPQQQPDAGETQHDESSTHHDVTSLAAAANNNDHDNDTASPPAAAAAAAAAIAAAANNRVRSNRHLQVRDSFNAPGVRREARSISGSTLKVYQSNNIRLILYLYKNKAELLVGELRRQLDANAEPNYSDVVRCYPEYVSRGGKKSLDERKEEFREGLLKEVICYALGAPGTPPRRQVIDFVAFTADVDIFVDYVTGIRKDDGALNKARSYASHRSSLGYLFAHYRYVPSREFDEGLKESSEGIKRRLAVGRCLAHYRHENIKKHKPDKDNSIPTLQTLAAQRVGPLLPMYVAACGHEYVGSALQSVSSDILCETSIALASSEATISDGILRALVHSGGVSRLV